MTPHCIFLTAALLTNLPLHHCCMTTRHHDTSKRICLAQLGKRSGHHTDGQSWAPLGLVALSTWIHLPRQHGMPCCRVGRDGCCFRQVPQKSWSLQKRRGWSERQQIGLSRCTQEHKSLTGQAPSHQSVYRCLVKPCLCQVGGGASCYFK